ncbi:MAG: head GIN domain-containing protein [Trueperaceae bacterium]
MKTETREVTSFNSVELRAFGDMTITQGTTESLVIEGDEEMLEKISSRVEGTTLILELGQNWLGRIMAGINAIGRKPVNYHITVKDLQSLKVMGSSDVHIPSLKTTKLHLIITGNGEVKLPSLTAEGLEVTISGRGELDVAGQVQSQTISIAGSGEYDAKGLTSQTAKVSISGHGDVEVAVNETLEVKIAGYGEVKYVGNPQVKQSIAGAGSVKQVATSGSEKVQDVV